MPLAAGQALFGKVAEAVMAGTEMLEWFAAQAKPNSWKIAARNLCVQGFDVFMPMEKYTLRKGSRLVASMRPYFAGYFFVAVDAASAPWRAIRSTHGVARLVSFCGKPAPVDAGLIGAIKSRCDDEGVMMASLELKAGDGVRIEDGPFAGMIGRLDALMPNERAWLLIDVMGKATRTMVPIAGLRRAI